MPTLYIARTANRGACWLDRDGRLSHHVEHAARHEFEWQAQAALQRYLWDNARDLSEGEVIVIDGLAAEAWLLADKVRARDDDNMAEILNDIGNALRYRLHSDERISAMSSIADTAQASCDNAEYDAARASAEAARDDLGDPDPLVRAGARADLAEFETDARAL